ncbi:MAG: glutamyl-tRNA reductase [Cyclobacteriaceae bacterium]|nr:glutamyl-tRNA reductase [Cyclobacteriaceae bacterium]
MSDQIPLGLIGISHRTAPVEIREQVALSVDEQKMAIRHIVEDHHSNGCLILSTCNRTEIYLSDDRLDKTTEKLRLWLNELKQCHAYTDMDITYELRDREVVEHFFKVLAGLDSLIIGEQQITGQVKESYDLTHDLNGTDALINKLFNFAMQAKKKVHNETFLSDGTVSVSFAGVELARKIFSDLSSKNVLMIGAGKTAELAAFHFQENGVKNINVANRTFERAKDLADKFDGKAYRLDELPLALAESDIVISATSSEAYVVTADMIYPISKKRNHRPIFLIDLAIPRDIDPEINTIDAMFLYNLDDLQEIVKANMEKRKKEIPKSMKIIHEYVDEFQKWVSMNSMTSIVGRLKNKLDTLRLNEMDRLKAKLPQNGYVAEIDHLTESIINKVVRQHVKSLKKVAHDPELYKQQIAMILSIYEIEDEN